MVPLGKKLSSGNFDTNRKYIIDPLTHLLHVTVEEIQKM
jgi:hypothetical protein